MIVPLSRREIEAVIKWKKGDFWPDEERVLRKLRRALDGTDPPDLSRLQVRIILGWAEERVGGHYGGRIVNVEERSILDKLEGAGH
jgi:hypothetical protein